MVTYENNAVKVMSTSVKSSQAMFRFWNKPIWITWEHRPLLSCTWKFCYSTVERTYREITEHTVWMRVSMRSTVAALTEMTAHGVLK